MSGLYIFVHNRSNLYLHKHWGNDTLQ